MAGEELQLVMLPPYRGMHASTSWLRPEWLTR